MPRIKQKKGELKAAKTTGKKEPVASTQEQCAAQVQPEEGGPVTPPIPNSTE